MEWVYIEYNLYKIEVEKKSQCFCLTLFYNEKEKIKQFMFKKTEIQNMAQILGHQKFVLSKSVICDILDKLQEIADIKTYWC